MARQEQSIRNELESMAVSLVESSDALVTNLGQTTERNSQNLTLLECGPCNYNCHDFVAYTYTFCLKFSDQYFPLHLPRQKPKKEI